jgi:hypothetical protein
LIAARLERADERGELHNITIRAEALAVRGKRGAEVRIAHHRSMPMPLILR